MPRRKATEERILINAVVEIPRDRRRSASALRMISSESLRNSFVQLQPLDRDGTILRVLSRVGDRRRTRCLLGPVFMGPASERIDSH